MARRKEGSPGKCPPHRTPASKMQSWVVCGSQNETMTQDKIGNQLGLANADFWSTCKMSHVIYLTVPRISQKGRDKQSQAPSRVFLIASSVVFAVLGASRLGQAHQHSGCLWAHDSFQPMFVGCLPGGKGASVVFLFRGQRNLHFAWIQSSSPNLTPSGYVQSVSL